MTTSPLSIAAQIDRLLSVRQFSQRIVQPLETEDVVIQSMPDVSPAKWHLAHTTWFFETFVLGPALPGYTVFHPQFCYLFNSYYNAVGERHPRALRGMLSRPTINEVLEYRAYVDEGLRRLRNVDVSREVQSVIEIGIHHEHQHQELMLTDIKHVLSINPLKPAYRVDLSVPPPSQHSEITWTPGDGGIQQVGFSGEGFSFDNESPRHDVLIHNHEIANRLVTNGEYLAFIDDAGYQRPEHWLSEGWDAVRTEAWTSPLYWEQVDGEWQEFTLGGMRPLDPNSPVTHVSFFEADAYARWAGVRLPTEFEWELAASRLKVIEGNFADADYLHPLAVQDNSMAESLRQMFGDVWEWTSSPYIAYPGYRPAPGAIGEYNGKFMSSQWVLRGGSCATSLSHIRPTYRNFFHPDKRWQFTGIRLAR